MPEPDLSLATQAVPAAAADRRGWRDRSREWIGILSAYFATQTLTQLTGIGAGLLFINFMPVHEFALYTLSLSVITFFTFISDLGSTGSLLHFYREAAATGEDFGRFHTAVLSLRRTVFLVGSVAVLGAFPAVALAKGFSLAEALPVTLLVVANVWFQINVSLRLLALRLDGEYSRSYRAELAGSLLRVTLAGIMVVMLLLKAWLGVFASALASGLVAMLARGRTPAATVGATDLRLYRRRVVRYLLPTLPSALYFSIQGPLVIWLSATFGSARTIAEVGAVGRLSLLVGLFSSLTGVVFLPRLSRVTDDRLYRKRYFQYGGFLALVAGGLLLAAALFPRGFLLLLGPRYSGLHRELLLVVASSGLALLDGYAVGINSARSWNRWQAHALMGTLVIQALLIAVLPLSTTFNVLRFNVFTAAWALMVQAGINLVGFRRPEWVRWA